MTQVRQPLAVIHVNSKATDNRQWLVEECIAAFNMKNSEAELLRFYALKCSNGFKPAALFIERQTGLDRREVYRSREWLIQDGLLNISDKIISVDWDRIRLFASLKNETGLDGTPAIARQRRFRQVAPAQKAEWNRDEYISHLLGNPIGTTEREEGLDVYMYLRFTPEQLSAWLSTLTEKEYQEFRRSIRKYKKHLETVEKNCHHTIDTDESDKVIDDVGKKLHYTIYTDKTTEYSLADLPKGPYTAEEADSYKIIEQDKATEAKYLYPELYDEWYNGNSEELPF